MNILTQYDISEYLFEEFCEKWVFVLYERAITGEFHGDYDLFWEEFENINPDCNIIYDYITSLETRVIFSNNDKNNEYFSFKVYQKNQKNNNNIAYTKIGRKKY